MTDQTTTTEHRTSHAQWYHPVLVDSCPVCQLGIERFCLDHAAGMHHPDKPSAPLQEGCPPCDAWRSEDAWHRRLGLPNAADAGPVTIQPAGQAPGYAIHHEHVVGENRHCGRCGYWKGAPHAVLAARPLVDDEMCHCQCRQGRGECWTMTSTIQISINRARAARTREGRARNLVEAARRIGRREPVGWGEDCEPLSRRERDYLGAATWSDERRGGATWLQLRA